MKHENYDLKNQTPGSIIEFQKGLSCCQCEVEVDYLFADSRCYRCTTIEYDNDAEGISDLKVMKSAAGYYLGTSYFDEDSQSSSPYSRDTMYMTESEAIDLLNSYGGH